MRILLHFISFRGYSEHNQAKQLRFKQAFLLLDASHPINRSRDLVSTYIIHHSPYCLGRLY